MLKDITLGQYFPGQSPIHRFDPRLKVLMMVAYIVALFCADGPWAYLFCFFMLALCIGLSRIKPKMMIKGLKPVLFIISFTAILNMFYTPGVVLWEWWIFTLTREGIFNALYMVSRIVMLIMCTALLTYTTSPIALTDALEHLLGPLKRLHVPVHEFTMMMTIALRFIPTLIEETDKIMSAQKARGADFDSGNLVARARALVPVLVPLFVSAFRRADELATAMECRLYHGGEGRTRLRELHLQPLDWLGGGLTALCVAGVFVISRFWA